MSGFSFDEAADGWMDTKGRGELRAILGEIVSRDLSGSSTRRVR